jgi:hypothetical protein
VTDELKLCPACGALPCDQGNDPYTPDPRLERLLAAVKTEIAIMRAGADALSAAFDAFSTP